MAADWVVGRAELNDLVVLGSDPGQGLASEVGEILDCRIRLGKIGFELFDFCFEAFDLSDSRVRGFSGLLQLLEPVLEFGAQVGVGAGAVEGGAVDPGLECEGLDIAVAAGWDLAAQQPVHGGADAVLVLDALGGSDSHGLFLGCAGSGGCVDVGDDPEGAVVVGLQAGAFGGAGLAELAEEGLGAFGVLGPDGPVVLVVGGLRAACGVTHADHRSVRGRGAGEFQAERAGGVGEPAVVRGAEVQRLRAFGQQVEDVAVVALDLRCRSRFGVQVGVDGGEEVGQAAGAGAGGQDALLIVAELGQHELEFVVGLVLVDFGQQLRLGTARSSRIALRGRRSDMFEVQFCCEDTAGPVSHLQRNRPSEHPQCHRFVGDRGEPEAGSGRGVHPGAEPQVADPEVEPGQQENTVARVVVQLLEEFDRAVDRFDDDPFVVGAAEALAFDDLAGDAVALQAGDRFLDRAAAADPQFHQLAGPHSGRGGQDDDGRGAGDADQGDRFGSVQWQCPGQQGCAVGGRVPRRRCGRRSSRPRQC